MKNRVLRSIFLFLFSLVVLTKLSNTSFGQTENKERYVAENKIKKLKETREFDYFESYKQIKEKEKTPKKINYSPHAPNLGSFSKVLPYIFIGLFIVVLLFVLYTILIENKRSAKITRDKKIEKQAIIEEIDEESIAENDFDALILRSLAMQDYRLVLRLYFLKSLQLLHDKKQLNYKKNKTNYEYSFEIKNIELRNKFLECSDVFSWIWYGKDFVDEANYKELLPVFDRLILLLEKKKL